MDAVPFRVGQGFDSHALVPDRKLILGGVTIPHHLGLQGHSDADVLLHAIIDALVGALSLGDIGRHFPDTQPQHKNADSRTLLRSALALVHDAGYIIGNIDSTIIAEAPRLTPHIPGMVKNISDDLHVLPTRLNVKAKTNEKMGHIGREEGIAAQAVVLLVRSVKDSSEMSSSTETMDVIRYYLTHDR